MASPVLLEVKGLRTHFASERGEVRAVDGVDLRLERGRTLGIVGESGSGKSVTAQAVMGILDMPPAVIRSGQILHNGRDLLTMDDGDRRTVRGAEIAMVFQDALSALNPVFSVGWQIAEAIRVREGASKSEAMTRAVWLMERVRIPAARERIRDYPHQFSGGMRQRVMIAMALALNPKVLIADEPTTALDVTVQAQVMDLLADLQRDTGMALILITHDLGVVASVAARIAVMYAGRIVEHADAYALYERPAHPYTRALIESIPSGKGRTDVLKTITGLPPNLTAIPPGCPFHPRCPIRQDICTTTLPPSIDLGHGRTSACHFAEEVIDGRI